MKKAFILIMVILFILPVSVFAKAPTEFEVQQTTYAVMTTFGLLFLASMFGQSPEGVTADMNINDGTSTMTFDSFDAEAYINSMPEMNQAMQENSDTEMPEFGFSSMSGDISVDENGNMKLDLNFKGGNVNTLKMETLEEELLYFTANGIDYSYLDFDMID